MAETLQQVAARLTKHACWTYTTHAERAAMRCGIGDAAGLLDRLAEIVKSENIGKRGGLTKKGAELHALVKRCGDAVWDMRAEISVPSSKASDNG